MATTNFVNNTTLSEAAWFNDVDATIYEQHGVGKTTVASATTPDIFAATVGHFIDYTGTATCTGFAAAVSAGSHRELYCADACLFTAGANLLIEGIPSGTTITLAAGALVQVRAITTTQFKMTYSVSGTFTISSNPGDFTVQQSGTAKYSATNGVACLYIPAITGTSSATVFTLIGIPAVINPKVGIAVGCGFCQDNGVDKAVTLQPSAGNTIVVTETDLSAWTASGTKKLYATSITYLLG